MPLHPDEQRSSASAGLLIAVVVVCLLVLGALILVVLGALFFTASTTLGPQSPTATAVLGEVEPQRMLEEGSFGGEIDPSPTGTAAADDSQTAADQSADGDARSSPDVPPTGDMAADGPPKAAATSLAEIGPMEVVDVQTGEQPLVRPVQVAGQLHPRAIWAQPASDLGTCQVSYALEGRYRQLRGTAAIVDAAEGHPTQPAEVPSATFRIYGDGNLLWDSGLVSNHGASQTFDVVVEDIRLLVLVVESESPRRVSHFAWVDGKLH